MSTVLTVAEDAAIIMLASVMLEYAPEAVAVAVSPFIDDKGMKEFRDKVAALCVERCLPAMRKGFSDGFDSLDTPYR